MSPTYPIFRSVPVLTLYFLATRGKYYEEALEEDPGYLFEARFGLLLEDAVHHAFDRGELAFFEQVRKKSESSYCFIS